MNNNYKLVHLYPSWENILTELSNLFCFEFEKKEDIINNFKKLQNSYQISDLCFARKADVDDYIINGISGNEYSRATVLYSLYSCNYLVITDIDYPSYQDWKQKNYGMSLDHKLPRYWFPQWTFDCDNWQGISLEKNKEKGDDFLDTGVEKLQSLSSEMKNVKFKYL